MATIDALLDQLWLLVVSFFTTVGYFFFTLTCLLHPYGAAVTITAIAFWGVCITKILNRIIITRRYKELEEEFYHWHNLRQEAMQCEDREKGRNMARNIDQARLNKAYYDYFFEGLLLGMARKVIPLFFLFVFVNEMYRPEQLRVLFGQNHVLVFPSAGDNPFLIGTVLWFSLSLVGGYLCWHLGAKFLCHFSNK